MTVLASPWAAAMKSELRRAWGVVSFFVGALPAAARDLGLARFAGLPACLAGDFFVDALVGGSAAFLTVSFAILRAGAVLRPAVVFLAAMVFPPRGGASFEGTQFPRFPGHAGP